MAVHTTGTLGACHSKLPCSIGTGTVFFPLDTRRSPRASPGKACHSNPSTQSILTAGSQNNRKHPLPPPAPIAKSPLNLWPRFCEYSRRKQGHKRWLRLTSVSPQFLFPFHFSCVCLSSRWSAFQKTVISEGSHLFYINCPLVSKPPSITILSHSLRILCPGPAVSFSMQGCFPASDLIALSACFSERTN